MEHERNRAEQLGTPPEVAQDDFHVLGGTRDGPQSDCLSERIEQHVSGDGHAAPDDDPLGSHALGDIQPPPASFGRFAARRDVDHLLLVTDASMRGLVAAENMVGLSKELDINVRHMGLVVNRAQNGVPPAFQETLEQIAREA